MGLSERELETHCDKIINPYVTKQKIIVLCEGNIDQGKRTVQAYKKKPRLPDASFYDACVPNWWRENRPVFFNCGDHEVALRDRQDVV